MLSGCKRQRGDTMIEVLLAVTIFSVVAVMGLTVMNQGSAASQRSLEITLVRQEMDAQATTLRFMYDAAMAQKGAMGYDASTVSPSSAAGKWNAILALRKANATPLGDMVTGGTTCIAPASLDAAFAVNAKTASVQSYSMNTTLWSAASVYSRVRYEASPGTVITGVEGLWVEAVQRNPEVRNGVTTPGYTDFHIRACWSTVGQSRPATLGTIVRLYEP